MKKLFESVFGEGVKVDNLSPEQLKELQDEAKQYAKDWPDETFTFVLKGVTERNPDVDESYIGKAKDLVDLLADGLGWDLNKHNLKDSDMQSIFAFLRGHRGSIKRDDQDGETVNYDFSVKSFKYNHSEDFIDLEADVTNCRLA